MTKTLGLSTLILSLLSLIQIGMVKAEEANHEAAALEIEKALALKPDPQRGREDYLLCAVCHQPEGWGTPDGEYPQISGQLYEVIIKQMADILIPLHDLSIGKMKHIP